MVRVWKTQKKRHFPRLIESSNCLEIIISEVKSKT